MPDSFVLPEQKPDADGMRAEIDDWEYLRGPGMPFVSPKDYWTIIRYRVMKAE